MVDASIEGLVRFGELLTLRWMGPLVGRIIRKVVEGARPATPDPHGWPEQVRAAYERTAPGYDTFLALPDARQAIAERGLPPRSRRPAEPCDLVRWRASPGALVRAAPNLGYEYIAVTDHGGGLPIANGMPVEKMHRQHATLEELAWMDIGRGQAALAGVPRERILNYLPVDSLVEWLRSKPQRVRRPAPERG